MSIDDLKIGAIDRSYWHPDLTRDGSKKRARPQHAEPEEDPVDEVTLSSDSENDEEPPGYFPAARDEEKK
jgi:hypothetical protein